MKKFIEYDNIKLYYEYDLQKEYLERLIKYLSNIRTSPTTVELKKDTDIFYNSLNDICKYCKIDLKTKLELIETAATNYERAINSILLRLRQGENN